MEVGTVSSDDPLECDSAEESESLQNVVDNKESNCVAMEVGTVSSDDPLECDSAEESESLQNVVDNKGNTNEAEDICTPRRSDSKFISDSDEESKSLHYSEDDTEYTDDLWTSTFPKARRLRRSSVESKPAPAKLRRFSTPCNRRYSVRQPRHRYTDKEKEVVLSLVQPRIQMIESKTLGEKGKGWEEIEREFNEFSKREGTPYRNAVVLRARYYKWKNELSHKLGASKNTKVKLTPLQEKLKDILDGLNRSELNENGDDNDGVGDDNSGDHSVDSDWSRGGAPAKLRRYSTPSDRLSVVDPRQRYTDKEKELLLSLVKARIQMIENGSRGEKCKVWKDIERVFNEFTKTYGTQYRSKHALYTRYKLWMQQLYRNATKNTLGNLTHSQKILKEILNGLNPSEPNKNGGKNSDGAGNDNNGIGINISFSGVQRYTDKENEVLLSLIQPRIQIINSKTRGEKYNVWKDIEREFNEFSKREGTPYRKVAVLRTKYHRWKDELTKILKASKNMEVKLNPLQEKLKVILNGLNQSQLNENSGKDSYRVSDDNSGDDAGDSDGDNGEALEKVRRRSLSTLRDKVSRAVSTTPKHHYTDEENEVFLSLIQPRIHIIENETRREKNIVWNDIEREFNEFTKMEGRAYRTGPGLRMRYFIWKDKLKVSISSGVKLDPLQEKLKDILDGLNQSELNENGGKDSDEPGDDVADCNRSHSDANRSSYTEEENKILLSLILSRIQIIETETRGEKQKVWKDIERAFNELNTRKGRAYRKANSLRCRYWYWKVKLGKKLDGSKNQEVKLDPLQEKLKELLDGLSQSEQNENGGKDSDEIGDDNNGEDDNGEGSNGAGDDNNGDDAGDCHGNRGGANSRHPAYTDEENERLLSLVQSKIHLVENCERGRMGEVWRYIGKEFNKFTIMEGRPYRTGKGLWYRYSGWKKNLSSKLKAEQNKERGKKNQEIKLNPLEKKLKRILYGLRQSEPNENGGKGSDEVGDDNNSDDNNGDINNGDDNNGDDNNGDDNNGDNAGDGDRSHSRVSDYARASTPRERHSSVVRDSPHEDVGDAYESDDNDFNTRKRKRTFDKLLTEKTLVVSMQKQLIEDQQKERKLKVFIMKKEHEMQKQIQQLEKEKLECHLDILKREKEHKIEMFQLEKQEAVLRSEVLKRKLLFFQETEEC